MNTASKIGDQMGRFVVFGILLTAAILGGTVYYTFKNSAAVRHNVSMSLEKDFNTFAKKTAANEHLTVATVENKESFGNQTADVSYSYFVDTKKRWSFVLNDKQIVARVPALESSPPKTLLKMTSQVLAQRASAHQYEVVEAARLKVSEFLKLWLEEQFPKEKNIDLQVLFAGEKGSADQN
jgi:hypothetical protein